MTRFSRFLTPLGLVFIAETDGRLCCLRFDEQKHFLLRLLPDSIEEETPVLIETKRWLAAYFSGRKPDFLPPITFTGTPFQTAVWNELLQIPYGSTTTYGEIARRVALKTGKKACAQAVGGAVGSNLIAIVVPCHRVIGADGKLTGYAGGMDRKAALLSLETSKSLL